LPEWWRILREENVTEPPFTPKEIRNTLEEMFRYAVRLWRNIDYAAGTRVEASVAAARIAHVLLSFPEPLLPEEGDSSKGEAPPSEPE
jgi:hypothetical protein